VTRALHPDDIVSASIEALIGAASFDGQGLVAAIAQDGKSGIVRMLAWANAEALRTTASTGYATFYSRSRRTIWRKGESSGNVMRVRELRLDCDGDAVLYVVDAEGPSCHEGTTSCFARPLLVSTGAGGGGAGEDQLAKDDGPPEVPAGIVSRVAAVIAQRAETPSEKSYVSSLLKGGWPKILAKITEESREVVAALPRPDKAHSAHEAADVIFHLLVGLQAAGVPVDDVFAELRRRFGTSGLAEKAARDRGGAPGESS
jgi:phosphoribosyl-ATP pyrophosphohydrolase/phosphoribosyl-AMP cyclohydrolase